MTCLVRRLFCLALAIALLACAGEGPFTVHAEEPMLVLILSPDSQSAITSQLRALLTTTGTPFEVEFRSAERFEMRRASDGAVFDWQETAVPAGQFTPSAGNFVLAESASTRGLGRVDLRAGERYTLDVLTVGRSIVGETSIPMRPRPQLVERSDGTRMVEWPRDARVGGYAVFAETDDGPERVTKDTFYVLREDVRRGLLPPSPKVRITAMDPNWYRYLSDSTARVAGIEGARGVFGAKSTAEIDVPPRP